MRGAGYFRFKPKSRRESELLREGGTDEGESGEQKNQHNTILHTHIVKSNTHRRAASKQLQE